MNRDKPHKYKYHDFGDTRKTKDCWCGLHKEDPLHTVENQITDIGKKVIEQATDYSNLSQWIQFEIWKYLDSPYNYKDPVKLADRIIERVKEQTIIDIVEGKIELPQL